MDLKRLKSLIEFKNGKIAPKTTGKYPIYGGNGILGYCDDYNYEDAIIVGRVGAYCGSIHKADGKCWVSDNAIAGLPKDSELLEFYYYLLRELDLNKKQIGSSQPLLTQGILNNLDVQVPLNSRMAVKIAKTLSDLDAKIELNHKINTELEAMAKTIYEYWFVQFDFPDKNGRPYKSSNGKMLFNEQLKLKIPEGWKVKTISEWIKNDKSGDWGKEAEQGNYTEKVSCVRGADINGLNGNGEVNTPTRFILEKNSHKILDPHDLVVEISGGSPTQSTGRLAFITEETLERFENPLICSNFCKALTLKNEKFLYNFVYQWNRLYENNVLFGWEGKTSGIKNLLFDNFTTNYYVPVPPEHLAEKFYGFMQPLQAKKQKNLVEINELENLRDWLLPMLMNGQVSVGEAEEELRMVAEENVNYGDK